VTHELLGMLAIGVALATIFAVLRLWQTRATRKPDGELVRKLAHLAAGGAALTFPWLFDRLWPGLVLCAIGLAAALVARLWRPARDSIGRVVGNVERRSVGDLCLPIGVAMVWTLSGGDWVLHTIPVALLTLGDAAAAIVGRHFGRLRYRTTEGHKSIEGSSVLLIVGFIATTAILILSGAAQPRDAVVIGLTLALLVTLAEAIAWRGLDNLILPVFAAVLLERYLHIPSGELITRLVVLSVLAGGVLLMRSRTTLIAEGLIATTLFLYGYWALGDWPWLAAPLALVILWPMLPHSDDFSVVGTRASRARRAAGAGSAAPRVPIHGVGPVLAIGGPSLVCLLLHSAHGLPLLPVSVASLASATAIVILVQSNMRRSTWPSPMLIAIAILVGTAVASLTTAMLLPIAPNDFPWWLLLSVVAATVGTTIACAPHWHRRALRHGELRRDGTAIDGPSLAPSQLWLGRGIGVAVAAAIAAALLPLTPLGAVAS